MKLVTWNVNSIKVRLERALGFIERESPDVLCLQELKCTDADFPRDAFEAAGYRCAVHGQKTYNGVAILSKEEPKDVRTGLVLEGDDAPDDHARLIGAEIGGVRVISAYFPNGKEVGTEKWAYKLRWMRALRAHLDELYDPSEDLALLGDYNVAPDDSDAANPEKWADSVLCHPEAREALAHIAAWGLEDAFGPHHPEGGVYSWWDYRRLAFPKGDGLRIDHVFASKSLAGRSRSARVDRDERKGKQPSDHAPVIVEFA